MRQVIWDFLSIVAACFHIEEPIYEFGSLQVAGEGSADLRRLFPGLCYVGTDVREGPGVDRVLDLHNIDLPSQSAGTALCVETLEHVEYPTRALEEIHRILKPDGIAVISSTMFFPIHNYPHDYWRFTPEAFRSVLKPFTHSFVGFAGNRDLPHTVVGIGFKGNCPPLRDFEEMYRKWQLRSVRGGLSMLTWIRRLLTPPILSGSGRRTMGL